MRRTTISHTHILFTKERIAEIIVIAAKQRFQFDDLDIFLRCLQNLKVDSFKFPVGVVDCYFQFVGID